MNLYELELVFHVDGILYSFKVLQRSLGIEFPGKNNINLKLDYFHVRIKAD